MSNKKEENLIGCIVETQNPAIVRMMKSRGCQSSESNGAIQFSKEPILAFTKKYCDNIKLTISGKCQLQGSKISIDGAKAWRTTTGWEHLFIGYIMIDDMKKEKVKGIGVYSQKQNHYYSMFQTESGHMYYVEKWYDNDGNLIMAKKGSDYQTDRVYEI